MNIMHMPEKDKEELLLFIASSAHENYYLRKTVIVLTVINSIGTICQILSLLLR